MLPLALARRDAGHDVVVATGAPFLDRLPMRTVPGLPTEVDLPWAEQEVRRDPAVLAGVRTTCTWSASSPRPRCSAGWT
jgi:hypothetical protein